jgi:hypothetical protein
MGQTFLKTATFFLLSSPVYVDFLPEKNMYPNAYMDFLSEPEFTFSAFWKKKALFIHPAITQFWAGPRSKIKKEDAVAQNFDQES